MSTAKRDMEIQASVELLVAQFLARRCDGLIGLNKIGRNTAKDFRLYIPQDIEVKVDYKSELTKNIYIESENTYRKEKSGLLATKANRWVYYLPWKWQILSFCPKRMLQHLEQSSYQHVTNCGDNNSAGWIVPISDAETLDWVRVISSVVL